MGRIGLSWVCYWLGDVASRILDARGDSERWAEFWYPVYSRLMNWSDDLQRDDPRGPWSPIQNAE